MQATKLMRVRGEVIMIARNQPQRQFKIMKKKIDGCSAFGVLGVGVDALTAGNIPQVVN
jgi:hypothetical protein